MGASPSQELSSIHGIVDYKLILDRLVLGTIIGVPLGKVQMTAVWPQRTR